MADVLAVRNEYRLQTWTEIIRECRESGLSNREFCAQRGIGEKTYYFEPNTGKIKQWWQEDENGVFYLQYDGSVKQGLQNINAQALHMIEIRYGEAELKLPEDVDLKAVAVLLNSLRRHD